jgi:hypothetical protein
VETIGEGKGISGVVVGCAIAVDNASKQQPRVPLIEIDSFTLSLLTHSFVLLRHSFVKNKLCSGKLSPSKLSCPWDQKRCWEGPFRACSAADRVQLGPIENAAAIVLIVLLLWAKRKSESARLARSKMMVSQAFP